MLNKQLCVPEQQHVLKVQGSKFQSGNLNPARTGIKRDLVCYYCGEKGHPVFKCDKFKIAVRDNKLSTQQKSDLKQWIRYCQECDGELAVTPDSGMSDIPSEEDVTLDTEQHAYKVMSTNDFESANDFWKDYE